MPSLGDIAGSLGLEIRGDASLSLGGIAPLSEAGAQHLSFVAHAKYLPELEACKAGALILRSEWAEHWEGACLFADDPYLTYAYASRLFDSRPAPVTGVHPSAQVDPGATLAAGVSVGPNAVIAAGVSIGDDAVIGAGVYVGEGCIIGAGTILYPGVVLYHDVHIGELCTIHANAVIGADGLGFAPLEGRWEKILQLGGVRIGDRCEIGATSTVDRGALHDTVIGSDVIIDDQVHIGHGVQVGDGCAMAMGVGIGGSTRIGKRCQLAGQAGFADHIEIADDVHIAGQGRVNGSISEPGHYASGTPMQSFSDWSRSAVRFTQLDRLARRMRELEKAVAAVTAAQQNSEDPTP